jgi:Flp pilus assembly protein TadD
MGDIKTGEMYTLKALEKGNNFYLAYENLAAISALYDDPIEAKKNIVKYIERFPNDQRLYAVLAIAVYRNGEKEEAEKYALRGCEFSPDSNCIYILYQIEHNLPIGRL